MSVSDDESRWCMSVSRSTSRTVATGSKLSDSDARLIILLSCPWPVEPSRSCLITLLDPVPSGQTAYTIGEDMSLTMPAIQLQAVGVQEDEEIEIAFNVSVGANVSTSINLHFPTVQQGILLIRQHFDQVRSLGSPRGSRHAVRGAISGRGYAQLRASFLVRTESAPAPSVLRWLRQRAISTGAQ